MASLFTRSQPHRAFMDDMTKDRKPKNEDELFEFKDAWKHIPGRKLRMLVASMPMRCRKVIKMKGLPTKY